MRGRERLRWALLWTASLLSAQLVLAMSVVRAATAFSVRNGHVALASYHVSRFNTDGTTGSVPLTGPKTSLPQLYGGGSNWRRKER